MGRESVLCSEDSSPFVCLLSCLDADGVEPWFNEICAHSQKHYEMSWIQECSIPHATGCSGCGVLAQCRNTMSCLMTQVDDTWTPASPGGAVLLFGWCTQKHVSYSQEQYVLSDEDHIGSRWLRKEVSRKQVV